MKCLLIIAALMLVGTPLLAQPKDADAEQHGEQARDPHAYSEGYTLAAGPYALPRQLKLADEYYFWSLLANRLEYSDENETTRYDLQGGFGGTYDRFVIKAEGDIADSRLTESQTELFWGHAIAAYWDTQLGVRFDDYDEGRARQWLAFGVQGLAPYWFELEMTAYLGDDGRTALAVEIEYELLLTQRLILQPRVEMILFGKDDQANALGRGLAEGDLALRLRYEFSRQFAPYVGVEWVGQFGRTADYAELAGASDHETRYMVGVRFWF